MGRNNGVVLRSENALRRYLVLYLACLLKNFARLDEAVTVIDPNHFGEFGRQFEGRTADGATDVEGATGQGRLKRNSKLLASDRKLRAKAQFRLPTHFQKSFFILFQYLFDTTSKNFNTITHLQFSKFYSWNTMQKHLQNRHQR